MQSEKQKLDTVRVVPGKPSSSYQASAHAHEHEHGQEHDADADAETSLAREKRAVVSQEQKLPQEPSYLQ